MKLTITAPKPAKKFKDVKIGDVFRAKGTDTSVYLKTIDGKHASYTNAMAIGEDDIGRDFEQNEQVEVAQQVEVTF